MTLNEFKAWFDGFTEDMEGPPKAKQWARIQERVKEITGNPVSYPVYVDRYWNRPMPWWTTYGIGGITGSAIQVGSTQTIADQGYNKVDAVARSTYKLDAAKPFDGLAAMYTAGKADAADLH